jgi:hypothetical protein
MVFSHSSALVAAFLFALNGHASPTPTDHARPDAIVAAPPANVTPFKVQVQYEPTKTLHARADILSKIESGVGSVLSQIGSAVPSYVAQGIPNFFQDFPTQNKVQSSLSIGDAELAALPTQVLNLPPYGNWTADGWNIRFRGNVTWQLFSHPDVVVPVLRVLLS